MIKDQAKLTDYQKEWNTVREFQNKIQRHLNATMIGVGAIGASHELRDISHNLVLLFAFSVLEDVLKQLKDEGKFNAKKNGLKCLMDSSKNSLPWQDFVSVDEAREKRNSLAHDQILLPREKCWCYVDAIEAELISWNVVKSEVSFTH